MWWKTRNERVLEQMVEELRAQNNILLAALLEKAGAREAANMLHPSPVPQPSLQDLREKAKVASLAQRQAPAGRTGWRTRATEAALATMTPVFEDSVEKLKQKVEGAN